MRTFLIHFTYKRSSMHTISDGSSFTQLPDKTAPTLKAWAEREALDLGVPHIVITNVVEMDSEKPEPVMTPAMRQRLTDLVKAWRKDTGQYHRAGLSAASNDLAAILAETEGQ